MPDSNKGEVQQGDDMCEVIVEYNMDTDNPSEQQRINKVLKMGRLKYHLPMINSCVIEIPRSYIDELRGIEGIKSVHHNARITAQMKKAREVVNARYAYDSGVFGKGVTIAILDTGICPLDDFTKPANRIIAFKDFVNMQSEPYDDNGHGTHVAGIAAGNGFLSGGEYSGIAPQCSIISIKILNHKGEGTSGSVLAGLQWVLDNKEKYNIRIANLSIGTSERDVNDPLISAVNAAWERGIIITVAAGNNGPQASSVTSPGISKKVITVGASDDGSPVRIWGDSLINFSGRGPTHECIIKPDVVAPGSSIISCLTDTPFYSSHGGSLKTVGDCYVQLSGTSMSTPIVAGAIALYLEINPKATPNEVKLRLRDSAVDLHCSQNRQGWGMIDVQKLLT